MRANVEKYLRIHKSTAKCAYMGSITNLDCIDCIEEVDFKDSSIEPVMEIKIEPTDPYYFKDDGTNHLAMDIDLPKIVLNDCENSGNYAEKHFSIENKSKTKKRKQGGDTQNRSGPDKCYICFEGKYCSCLKRVNVGDETFLY